MTTKIAIYSRKSKLTDKGESIKNQIELCKDYCRQYSDTEFLLYEDEGYSGGNTERPAFHRMINDAKKAKFDSIICYKLDRISRNVSDFSTTLDTLNQYNISFLSVKEHFDTSTPMGRAMMYITSVFAQLERETIAERIQDNLRQLARTGRWLGGVAPTGFCSEKETYLDEHGHKKYLCRLIPVSEEITLVQLLFQKYIELGSQTSVIRYTIKNGITTKRNSDFCTRSLRNILSNPVYVQSDSLIYHYYKDMGCDLVNEESEYQGNGLLLTNRFLQTKKKNIENPPNKWVIAVGAHKGCIPSEQFIQVQKLLKGNKEKSPRANTSTIALVSSLIVCPHCGTKMLVSCRKSNSAGSIHYYYRCRTKNNSNGTLCSMPNLNGKKADSLIRKEMETIILNNKQYFMAELVQEYKKKDSFYQEQICGKIEKEIETLNIKIKQLTKQLEKNYQSTASKYIISQIEEYDKQISYYQNNLLSTKNTSEENSANNLNYNNLLQKLIALSSDIHSMDLESQKKYIRYMVEQITLEDETLIIKLKH